VKELVTQLKESGPEDELFEARFKVLSEYVQHHVDEEEGTIFSAAHKADLDLAALGEQLVARKEELGALDQPINAAPLAAQEQTTRGRDSKRATR
jgi:hypothetical protein